MPGPCRTLVTHPDACSRTCVPPTVRRGLAALAPLSATALVAGCGGAADQQDLTGGGREPQTFSYTGQAQPATSATNTETATETDT